MPIISEEGASGGSTITARGASMWVAASAPYSAWGDNVHFDAADFDTDSYWHAATDTFRVPAGLGGLYLVEGIVYVEAEAGLTAVSGIGATDSVASIRNDFHVLLDPDNAVLYGSFSYLSQADPGDDFWIQLAPPGSYVGALPDIIGGHSGTAFTILRIADAP